MELVDPQSRAPHQLGAGRCPGRRRRGHGGRRRALVVLGVAAALLAAGCSDGEPPAPEPAAATTIEPSALLPTPYTADEIHEAWVEGLTLLVERSGPTGETHQRWTVVAADADGATIEFVPVDADDQPTGEPTTSRSTWAELRDHASFPAERATRRRATRDTPLGRLDGWVYRVEDEASGAVTEFFFADDTPGAPVEMVSTANGREVASMRQLERAVPEP